MHNTTPLQIESPSLPKGGGAITGLKGDVAAAGPDGTATLTLPLPISDGRGYAPALTLSYHSRAGNGPFGMGWDINLPAIRLRTRHGVPAYDGTDEFIGPDGEVLVPLLATGGTPEIRAGVTTLLDTGLNGRYTVHAYRSRTETSFSRLEYWVSEDETDQRFWVLYSPDGQVHLLGRNAQARISNPDSPTQTATWLAESSVSLTGEQIYWQYRAEDDSDCDDAEKSAHPAATAQRYLAAVWYGNKQAGRRLPGLASIPTADDWLFTLVLDYGERGTDVTVAPDWLAPGSGNWSCRQDRFSGWEYGFEVRTRRLCRQILMYHDVKALAGKGQKSDSPQLVARLCLDYAESPSVTTLKRVRQVAYEPDGTLCALPPLEYGWQVFTPPETVQWQPREEMGNLNLLQPYQMVDLNGEGLAGILYQDSGAWWYRAPLRQPNAGENAVTWDTPRPLPAIPSLREGGLLTDLNGDGQLEWVVSASGVHGYYDRAPEREWCHFTPLSALPVEYTHPRAQLADIIGAGFADLVLIGPKSVRLYSGTEDGWRKAQTVMQADGVTLPVPGTDARVLVAFSDMAGSGQQHLVEVRADGVRYWPNIGHGRFSSPVNMPGFSPATELPSESFNPDRLYLADIDGSGTTDLIYACRSHLRVYRNLSGNAFAEPFTVTLPAGVHYDNTCNLQLADIQGLGVASLVLTVPHPQPRHWVCHLSENKPWLLSTMNNHMGARHTLHYRSSAQFWLDEKAEAVAAGKPIPASYLPFALHTLARTEVADEITGNRLVSTVRYRHGAWDGWEREFRGFGFVEVSDTDTLASRGTADHISMPAISRSWFATGLAEVDDQLQTEYWTGDSAAFDHFTPRFTLGNGETEQAFTPDNATAFWLKRGLKGLLLRSELYGADGSSQANIPYTITENHLQVRLVDPGGTYPVIWPVMAESRTYTYERISSDPQCSQQVLLSSDEYGNALRQVSINYPRRNQPTENPYPDTLPETLFGSSFDKQQQTLRLTQQQNSWHVLLDTEKGIWLPGLADGTRRDVFNHAASAVPTNGVTIQLLLESSGLLAETHSPVFAGQQRIWYLDNRNEATTAAPDFPPLPAFTETAVLDEDIVALLSAHISPEGLRQADYLQTGYLFPRAGETNKTLWVIRQGYATYAAAAHFWLPQTWRETLLTGVLTITRDRYDCVITQTEDAAGLKTTTEYDWRFLTPVRVIDANDNVQSITLDALGRIISRRISGTENGVAAGYSDTALTLPDTAEEMFSLQAPLPVAQCMLYVTDSWQDGKGLPPHAVTLVTDHYDRTVEDRAAQQIRQQVIFSDGFGRVLQTAVRQVAGEAWQRTDEGALVIGSGGKPAVAETTFRWAVSGRAEYDNKGQAIRTYQPYFLDSWKYVSDDSARQDLYADTHCYDPVGREWQVITAKGWLRRSLFTPWFVVSEDENDTLAETSASA
ncbi:virulence protein [Xenorhabdus sp. DI]|uniref:SpvB/TcaC N-terminal domain-containing protein n=1 Tax=Xenorhabdus doucetiae TaxID=351671 RepID=UPI001998E96C|nr:MULTISPECIES: SpvB/TcaC N-terminal domain-containing protein [unclassified Xenorhabdus]MBD2784169.1 virulence protein [Xenorhabdus sp. 3]MBD2789614.1 virulence protein [Xenorhabdus sp. DI]